MVVSEAIEFMPQNQFSGTVDIEPRIEPIAEPLLNEKPVNRWKYKCHTCKTVINEKPCPECGETFLEEMCELDNITCTHEISDTIKYCEKCGKPVCPVCNCHDVIQLSRVTGYYQSIEGFNNAKKQEVKDRIRSKLGPDGNMHRTHQSV